MIETRENKKKLPKFPFYPIILVIALTIPSLFVLWAINSDNLRALNVIFFVILLWLIILYVFYKKFTIWRETLQNAFQEIAFSEARHRILMNNASCCIFTADRKGFILDVNKEGEILLGMSRENIIGKNIIHFIPEKSKDNIENECRKNKDNASVTFDEFSIVDANNRRHDVDASMVMVNLGEEKLMMIIATDITEKNKLRVQAILNDRLSSIGTLAAGIAHELNNPIAWIKSNLQLLESGFKKLKNEPNQPKLLESFEESVSTMIEGSNRVADIVNNFGSFMRVDDTTVSPTNIHEVLVSAIDMVLPEIKNNAELEKVFSEDLPLVEINRGYLHQVFLNLLINAYQAIHNPNINCSKITIKTYQEGSRVCISFQDTGEGIPNDILPHIFDLFFTTKPVGKGTGFGLFICHDIIQKFGGEIKVETEVQKGTTFLVYLPIYKVNIK